LAWGEKGGRERGERAQRAQKEKRKENQKAKKQTDLFSACISLNL